MYFLPKGVTMEQVNKTGQKIAIVCELIDKTFKEGELNNFLWFIDINESIPMATREFTEMIEHGPKATKRVRAIGELIKVTRETRPENAKRVEASTLGINLMMLLQQMEKESLCNTCGSKMNDDDLCPCCDMGFPKEGEDGKESEESEKGQTDEVR